MSYRYTPDTCPSKHWNDGTDVCADCGKDLNPPEIMMKEYAFDVTLTAVVRVTAPSEEEARSKLMQLDAVNLCWRGLDNLEITEASLAGTHQQLFEVDGKEALS